jgi:hypothetical protein
MRNLTYRIVFYMYFDLKLTTYEKKYTSVFYSFSNVFNCPV